MRDALPSRRTYQDSCELLQQPGFVENCASSPIPDHQPQFDDEEPLGVGEGMPLSEGQRPGIDWQDIHGDEPPGG